MVPGKVRWHRYLLDAKRRIMRVKYCIMVKVLSNFLPEDRARKGIFLAFQYPIEIPGVSNANFLKTAVNEVRKSKGLGALDSKRLLKTMKDKMQLVKMDKNMTQSAVLMKDSVEERKTCEIFQMAMFEEESWVLDETDSGLDIDALNCV